MKRNGRILAGILGFLMLVAGPMAAMAAATNVGTYAQLVAAAAAGATEINITANITYGAGATTVQFNNSVTINGGSKTISGGTAGVQLIAVGTFTDLYDLTVSDLTMTGGNTNTEGGALFVSGNATVKNCTFEGNTAGIDGGGAFVLGNGEFTDVTFVGNTAGRFGGGAFVLGEGTFTDGTFVGNTAGLNGGGAFVLGEGEFTDVTFEGNEATNGDGGGALVVGDGTFTDVTFEGNTAGRDGGGLYTPAFPSTSLTLTRTDFYDNNADTNTGDSYTGTGDAIYSGKTVTVVGDSYYDGNVDGNQGHGINAPILDTTNGTILDGRRPTPPDPVTPRGSVEPEVSTDTPVLAKIANCAEWVYLRGDRSTDGAPEGTIALGTVVEVVDNRYGWCKIIVGGTMFFVAEQFIQLV